ncbi:hypothetical protein MAP00_008779 [Monascus purpureus]|nr:hypothetical protein MAP00_008779 [Monascus purpureus]
MMLPAIAIGILILRRRRPDLKRPFKAWLPAMYVRILVRLVLLAAPFFPPADGKGDVSFFYATYAIVGVGILLFAVLFWYVSTVYRPRRRGYRLEEKAEVLEDGTTITKLVRISI